MTLTRTCCCTEGELDYYILQPCYFQGTSSTKYLTKAAFATCGFDQKTIYKNGYCGYFRNSASTGGTLDNTCSNYTASADGCCGGSFDPCPNIEECCGLEDCLDYREQNALSVPLSLIGYTASTGSSGSWTVTVTNVSIGTPAFTTSGQPDFDYDVTITMVVSWGSPSGTITCDGSGTPPDATLTLSANVAHDVRATSACVVPGSTDNGTACGRSAAVCSGTTVTTGSGFTACDVVSASVGATTPTLNTGFPDFGDDCTPPGSAYSMSVPVSITLAPGATPAGGGCVPGCTDTGQWEGAYFPDVSASLTVTLFGQWQ